MAACLFYGPVLFGLLIVYLGLRIALGDRDNVWARYADAMRQRGQPVERTPQWDQRMQRLGLALAILLGGGLLVLSLVNYWLNF